MTFVAYDRFGQARARLDRPHQPSLRDWQQSGWEIREEGRDAVPLNARARQYLREARAAGGLTLHALTGEVLVRLLTHTSMDVGLARTFLTVDTLLPVVPHLRCLPANEQRRVVDELEALTRRGRPGVPGGQGVRGADSVVEEPEKPEEQHLGPPFRAVCERPGHSVGAGLQLRNENFLSVSDVKNMIVSGS